MSSRVLTGTRAGRVDPIHWLPACGEAVNAAKPSEDAPLEESAPEEPSQELAGAWQRITVLEKRIRELEAELPKRSELGHREGFAEGEKAGAAAAQASLAPLLDRLTRTIADLASYRARFRRDSEPELLRLALAVARKILRRELTVDPQSLRGVLKAALETINQAEVLGVRTSPEDAELLRTRLGDLGLPDHVEVTADRNLERGSVILDTRRGQVDASVQTQLAEIENGFADRIAAEGAR